MSVPPSVDDATLDRPRDRESGDRSETRARHLRLLLVVVVVVSLCLTVLQTGLGRQLLSFAGLDPQPSRYLELYFAYPGVHPTKVSPGGEVVQVAFVIRSHDLTVEDQGWTVAVSNGATETSAVTGTVTLRPGEEADITRGLLVPCAPSTTPSRSSIAVRLEGTDQQILFWLSCNPAAASGTASPSPSAR